MGGEIQRQKGPGRQAGAMTNLKSLHPQSRTCAGPPRVLLPLTTIPRIPPSPAPTRHRLGGGTWSVRPTTSTPSTLTSLSPARILPCAELDCSTTLTRRSARSSNPTPPIPAPPDSAACRAVAVCASMFSARRVSSSTHALSPKTPHRGSPGMSRGGTSPAKRRATASHLWPPPPPPRTPPETKLSLRHPENSQEMNE